jgi:PIN domain nuclease of toxin-antitoxin system
MKLLLDTHTFIWWDSDPTRLSARVLSALKAPVNEIYLSVVSIWEIVIKVQLGKLSLRLALAETMAHQQANGMKVLPVTLEHSLALSRLPLLHKDPFDRLLIAQAGVESAELVSSDHLFRQYPVSVFW